MVSFIGTPWPTSSDCLPSQYDLDCGYNLGFLVSGPHNYKYKISFVVVAGVVVDVACIRDGHWTWRNA